MKHLNRAIWFFSPATPKEIIKRVTETVAISVLDDNGPTTRDENQISTPTTSQDIGIRVENLDAEYNLVNIGDGNDLFVTVKDNYNY